MLRINLACTQNWTILGMFLSFIRSIARLLTEKKKFMYLIRRTFVCSAFRLYLFYSEKVNCWPIKNVKYSDSYTIKVPM